MTYPVAMEKDLCLICWGTATQYFDSHRVYPVCGRQACDEAMAQEVNEQLNEAAAESAPTQGE